MTFHSLLKVLDADQFIQVELNHKTIFKGLPDDFDLGLMYEKREVKCIWFSQLYRAIMIEL